jgi:predicted GH43/DUF377 family glycosyl hydrolase
MKTLQPKILIHPRQVKPTQEGYEVVGSFNPGVTEYKDKVYFLVRVAEKPLAQRTGHLALPRADFNGGYVIDWLANEDYTRLDARGVKLKNNGLHRFTTVSHLRLAVSEDGLSISTIDQQPWLYPEYEYEEYGIEDARITQIGDIYFITYVAASHYGIATALASTKDFVTVWRHGLIFPPENKNVVLFPEKIDGKFLVIHRPGGATPLGIPWLWLSESSDGCYWGNYKYLTTPAEVKNYIRIGAGAPPIHLEQGWLLIHHAVSQHPKNLKPGIYHTNAMLLEENNPSKVIWYRPHSIISPSIDFENDDHFANIIFSTGSILRDNFIYIYCGELDSITTVYKLPIDTLLR